MSDPGVELELAGMLVGLGETRDDPVLRRRTGTVTAVAGASYSVSIGGTVVAGVRSLVPLVVGDVAEIVFDGPRPLVVGHVDTGWRTVGATGGPVFQNSWVNEGGSWNVARFRKVAGIVHVEGVVKNGTVGLGWPIFQLPAGYRPGYNKPFAVIQSPNVVGRVNVESGGSVYVEGGSNVWVSLEGISFVAVQ